MGLQKQSEQQAAIADSIRALQKRVDEMSVNFSAHNSRILCLEDTHNSHRFAEEKVSCVLRALQRQQQQVTELLQDHELELQRLCLAMPSSGMQSESPPYWGGGDAEKSESLLKELRAEHASVNDVLLSVREEKIEVLTAMHTFHVNTSQSPQRRTKVSREIQDELTTCSALKWPLQEQEQTQNLIQSIPVSLPTQPPMYKEIALSLSKKKRGPKKKKKKKKKKK